ncbi:unnamed protein product [Rotaria sp. Silwood1]|nr:unnamed protein product [Rotaria sp. Silwood1]CAF0933751.1 unnamed protein product [Rotaria sp. Silwood1]
MTEPSIIPASEQHTATIIFLHGLDDVGKTWFDEFNMFDIPKRVRHVKYIFPTASIINISKNNGTPMTSWFDVYGFDEQAKEDQEGIEKASQLLNSFVEEEIKNGIPPDRIMVGGFSMGGAVALHTALVSPHTLGGVLALSTWLPLLNTFPKALVASDKKVNLPILQCHGNKDLIIQINRARLCEENFKAMGFKQYIFKEYDGMDHTNCEQVIFLHGLGDVGTSWHEIFNMYRIAKSVPYVKFIFPTAPIQKVTLNMGMAMTSWFDIFGLDPYTKEDQEGIEKSSIFLKYLVEEEIREGILPERIIIGGFSMGGAIALHAALTSPHTLAGVIALSTWLPLSTTFPEALVSGDNKVNLPILQCHGDQDPLVQLRWARLTEQGIKAMGFKHYTFKEYHDMGHSSCGREMKDVSSFIIQHLPKID